MIQKKFFGLLRHSPIVKSLAFSERSADKNIRAKNRRKKDGEMKTNIIALVVSETEEKIVLKETLHDESEIEILKNSIKKGSSAPLEAVYQFRAEKDEKENEFADHVEGLLCNPFLKSEVQEHAIQWFRSRIKIENFQKIEREAASVIAKYACEIFNSNRFRDDFLLSTKKTSVRIRVFMLPG